MYSILGVDTYDMTALASVQQRTPAWEQARMCRITASDVPAFLGQSRFTTFEQAVQRKLDADAGKPWQPPDAVAARMAVGVQQEPVGFHLALSGTS
jgi:hypothetical protein